MHVRGLAAALSGAGVALAVAAGAACLELFGTLRRKAIGQELPPATLAKGFASAFAGLHVKAIALTRQYVVWITTDGRVLRTDK